MIYDAHNHFHDPRLDLGRKEITAEVERLGVCMVINGTSEKDWNAVLDCASAYPWAVPALGLHPWFVGERSPKWRETLEKHLSSKKCAIGEIGLDRWMENPDVAAQEEVFEDQLEIAASRNLPASIHCLQAWGRLNELLSAQKLPSCGFLLHSYGGPKEMVKGFLDLGAYFSISGYFAHERKAKQRETFRTIPLDRLLIETDAPDMLPPEHLNRFPSSGAANHPANLQSVYEFAAKLWGQDSDEFAMRIETNFRTLFAALLD